MNRDDTVPGHDVIVIVSSVYGEDCQTEATEVLPDCFDIYILRHVS